MDASAAVPPSPKRHPVRLPNCGNEFFQRSFDALATQPTRNRFDEPPENRGETSAQPESFHPNVDAGVLLDECREAAGAPQISAVASGRKQVLVGLAHV